MSNFVNPSILSSLSTFTTTFKNPIDKSRDANATRQEKRLGEARSQELAARTSNFIIRRTNEILLEYLPEKVEEVLFIPLTAMQANIYRGLLRGKAIRQVLARSAATGNDALGQMHAAHAAAAAAAEAALLAADPCPRSRDSSPWSIFLVFPALQAINSLKKLCNHPGLVYEEAREHASSEPKSAYSFYPENYVPQSNFGDIAQSSKLAVLDHILTAVRREGKKIVVVSNYIQTLDMLQAFLNQRQYGFLRLDGQTNANDKSAIVDRFNANYASDAFVFLLSAKAGGLGLSLIGGNRLVLFDPDWVTGSGRSSLTPCDAFKPLPRSHLLPSFPFLFSLRSMCSFRCAPYSFLSPESFC
jgi:SNF2 family DNA or RNA helicase